LEQVNELDYSNFHYFNHLFNYSNFGEGIFMNDNRNELTDEELEKLSKYAKWVVIIVSAYLIIFTIIFFLRGLI